MEMLQRHDDLGCVEASILFAEILSVIEALEQLPARHVVQNEIQFEIRLITRIEGAQVTDEMPYTSMSRSQIDTWNAKRRLTMNGCWITSNTRRSSCMIHSGRYYAYVRGSYGKRRKQ